MAHVIWSVPLSAGDRGELHDILLLKEG